MTDNPFEELRNRDVEKAEKQSKMYEETIKQLQTEERFLNFFKGYNPQSVESFIKYYAQRKSDWYANADDRLRFRLRMDNHYFEEAMELFNEIFLKKLFDMKCRWVAGEMDLDGIESSVDFINFANDPNSCTFVEPITQKELDCYMQFKQLKNWVPSNRKKLEFDEEYDDGWASCVAPILYYHNQQSCFIENSITHIPPWFYYYDTWFGTAYLLDLPCRRTDLEEKYNDIWEEHIHPQTLSPEYLKTRKYQSLAMRKLHYENREIRDEHLKKLNEAYREEHKNDPKYIHLHVRNKEIMDEIVHNIESREVEKYYHATREWERRLEGGEEIEMDVIYLQELDEFVPINSNDDFRVAIKEAHDQYEERTMIEILPYIFDNYRQCIKNGEEFDWGTEEGKHKHSIDNRKKILEARVWKGEPTNFDFLKKENLAQSS